MLVGTEAEVPHHLQRKMPNIVMKQAQQTQAACDGGKALQPFKCGDGFERSVLNREHFSEAAYRAPWSGGHYL